MKIQKTVDLKGVPCPMNFVKTKLALESIEKGEIVEVVLDEGAPLTNVTRSLKDEGHRVIKVVPEADGLHFKVLVEKGN